MKNLILYAVLLLVLGCQAPKDRSGDAVNRPAANPNSNDPKVTTQVEPRVIVLDAEPLVLNPNREDKLNRMQKENLAEQSIEKTFNFTNETEDTLSLLINGFSQVNKTECLSSAPPVLKAVNVLEDGNSQTFVLDLKKPTEIATVKSAQKIKLTITMTNPGQCKALDYSFTVTPRKIKKN
jgi:hypothetical protein